MAKFRCMRGIKSANGHQEFEVEAEDEESARELFEADRGELVSTECEIDDLEEYDLDSIWEDEGEG